MKIFIVRHGETIENQKRICQGQMHGSLSEKGILQARQTGEYLKNERFGHCYCSDLQRAKDFCSYITAFHKNLITTYDKRLRERYFGSFQGMPFPADMKCFQPPSDTELIEDFYNRAYHFYHDITNCGNENLLVISHGVTIRALIAIAQQKTAGAIDSVDEIKNGALTVIETYQGITPTIILLNSTKHLQ